MNQIEAPARRAAGTPRIVADCLFGYVQGQVTVREALETLGLDAPQDLDAAIRDAGLTPRKARQG